MIIFHEGMPRSGKSYAATQDHIVPALKQGRRMYVRIDGIDHAKLADLAGITEERCRELLTELTEEDVHKLDQIEIENDSLVVLDELQNYWPSQKAPLSPGMTKWIAEHGHHGLDVLCMGQLLKDCHRTWVNRTNRKIQFVKKDMLGKPDEYKWRMFTGSPDARGNVKFVEVQKGDGKYDEKFFGCYKSHSEGTDNKGTYVDDRANVFQSAMFKKWLPILGAAVLAAIGYLVYLFNGGLAPATAQAKPVKTTETVTVQEAGKQTTRQYINGQEVVTLDEAAKLAKETAKDKPKEEGAHVDIHLPDVVGELSKENRIRLALIVRTAKRTRVVVEWRDTSGQLVDQMDDDDLETLGWHVATTNNNRLVILASPQKRLVATAWPLEERPGGKGDIPESHKDSGWRHPGKGVQPRTQEVQETRLPETSPVGHKGYQPAIVRSKWEF